MQTEAATLTPATFPTPIINGKAVPLGQDGRILVDAGQNIGNSQLWNHKNSQEVTVDQLMAMPTPEATKTYTPISHYDVAVNALNIGSDLMQPKGWEVAGSRFQVSPDQGKFFGVIAWESQEAADQGMRFSIGLRNSVDKKMTVGYCLGSQVIVCDNLVMSGDTVILRKHTGNAQDDLVQALLKGFYQATTSWQDTCALKAQMQALELNDVQAYGLLGVALDKEVITPTQFTKVRQEWKEPRHGEFEGRNLWSLYNGATEIFKATEPAKMLAAHSDLTRFSQDILAGTYSLN